MRKSNWMRTLGWLFNLEFKQASETEWIVDGQVGSNIKYKNLGFLKIKGAGHLVSMNLSLSGL